MHVHDVQAATRSPPSLITLDSAALGVAAEASNSIELDDLINVGAADGASPVLPLDLTQAAHASRHVAARNACSFNRGVQADDAGAGVAGPFLLLAGTWSSPDGRQLQIDRAGVD